MEHGWEFARIVTASTLGTSLLLAAAGWLCKAQITHWLNKDMQEMKARHQQELANKQAEYQRELESYRTSLIAQAEAIKASQDVKKAMAVKIAEMKFDAIQKLHEAAAGMGVMLSLIEASESSGLKIDHDAIAALGGSLHGAATKAKVFLQGAHYDQLIRFSNSYFEGVCKLKRIHEGRDGGDSFPIYSNLMSLHSECEEVVNGRMNEMLAMV